MLDYLRLRVFIGRDDLSNSHLFLRFNLVFSVNLSFSPWWLGYGLGASGREIILVWASAWVKTAHIIHVRLVNRIEKRRLFHLWQIWFSWNYLRLVRLLHLLKGFALINAISLGHVLFVLSRCELSSVCIGPREINFYFSFLDNAKLGLYPCFSTKQSIAVCFNLNLWIRLSWRMAQLFQSLLTSDNLLVVR